MKIKHIWLYTVLFFSPNCGIAEQAYFFRISSTQETHIISFEKNGELTWSNSVSNAFCTIEWASSHKGGWCTDWSVLSTGYINSVTIPMDNDTIFTKGTVRYMPFEGGFYGILGDDGGSYCTEYFPANFQHDGLRVNLWCRKLPGGIAILYQWGETIEIITISELED